MSFTRRIWRCHPAPPKPALRPISEAPDDGREILCTDGVYWRVCTPYMRGDGIYGFKFHAVDWCMAPTHFIHLEELPQVRK